MANGIEGFGSGIKGWSQSNAKPPEKQEKGIDTRDMFKKTDGNDDANLTADLLKSAALGAAAGIGLANRSEIKDLEKRVEALESEKAASSFNTVAYAGECLEKAANYTLGSKVLFFEHALNKIKNSADSTPAEKAQAELALKESDSCDEIVKFTYKDNFSDKRKRMQEYFSPRLASIIYGETMKSLSEGKEEASFGKAVLGLRSRIYGALRDYNENDSRVEMEDKGIFKTFMGNADSKISFDLAMESIANSDHSNYYEKTLANYYTDIVSHYDDFVPVEDFKKDFAKGIMEASENSNPVKDIVGIALKYIHRDYGFITDRAFELVAASSDSGKGDKALAAEGLEVGKKDKDIDRSPEDIVTDKFEILEKMNIPSTVASKGERADLYSGKRKIPKTNLKKLIFVGKFGDF